MSIDQPGMYAVFVTAHAFDIDGTPSIENVGCELRTSAAIVGETQYVGTHDEHDSSMMADTFSRGGLVMLYCKANSADHGGVDSIRFIAIRGTSVTNAAI
jgi:ATP-dependent phosphoenolpyruvate carboxykinase